MDDLDRILDELAGRAQHPRLEEIDARLVARIAVNRRERGLPMGTSLAMIATALGIGLASGQATARRASPSAVSLDAGIDLAPSTRLVTTE